MDVVRGLEQLPIDAEATAVTIGFFDGVHLGHQAVFARTVQTARDGGLVPVAVTFDRHPREILTPGREPRQLTTLSRKAELIAALGIQALVVLVFDEELSRVPADEFVKQVLVEGLRARRIVVGANFTFGHRALGTVRTLEEMGGALGFSTEAVPLRELDGRPLSSTTIRQALSEGDLEWPRQALGRRYAVDGRVGSGAGRGATLGYPTANLDTAPKILLPDQGVYAGRAFVAGGDRAAAINIGTNPTFGVEPLHLEAFLLDFQEDIRGEAMTIEFWQRLREEVRFPSAEALTAQIALDVQRTRAVVGRAGPAER
ncbi:MAG TPA: bifunctional riboflavin kinase/FAD synthetase [Actinomycetota bacterium]|jgi:riboflavin kinase/FMN adenylyltransferase